ncbi:MAG: dihydroorotate dehydrogenase B catalytic subunit [Deltaproteobacteria bacterium]|nr:dihydroorotate dehydrogenase B catalytic subunit [Deltaproteobacteria bacterium]
MDERVEFAGIPLRNPVLTASGTFGYGTEFAPFLDLETIGGFVAKSLTLEPRFGNPPPRIAETPAGLLNAISIENVGVRAFLEEKLPALPEGVVVIASAFGTEPSEYAELAARVCAHPRIAAIEINASCPHVKAGGIEFGQDPELLGDLVRTVRDATEGPLLVKLSPNVTRIADMARVCEAEGADGISLINAVQAMEVDVESRRPVLSNVLGGLSGPAIRPIALRMVYQAAQAVKIPICGVGGISDAEDAIKFLLCGATAVQVGTSNYLDPGGACRIASGIADYARRHGFERVAQLTGSLDAPRG